MIDSTMCCPPRCCSSQPLSGGWQAHKPESGWLPLSSRGQSYGGVVGGCTWVMGSAGTGALLSGGLRRAVLKKKGDQPFIQCVSRSLLLLPWLILAGGRSRRAVLHLLNIRRHPLEEIRYFIIVNSIWVAQLLGKFVNAPYQHNISQWDKI